MTVNECNTKGASVGGGAPSNDSVKIMPDIKAPAACISKSDIRTAIDGLDEELLQIFARRQEYVRRMAQLKQHPDEAFDAQRIEAMVVSLRGRAEQLGLDKDQVDTVWRALMSGAP